MQLFSKKSATVGPQEFCTVLSDFNIAHEVSTVQSLIRAFDSKTQGRLDRSDIARMFTPIASKSRQFACARPVLDIQGKFSFSIQTRIHFTRALTLLLELQDKLDVATQKLSEYSEFIRAMCQRADREKTGMVTPKHLITLIRQVEGIDLDSNDVHNVVNRIARDGDGFIYYEKFISELISP